MSVRLALRADCRLPDVMGLPDVLLGSEITLKIRVMIGSIEMECDESGELKELMRYLCDKEIARRAGEKGAHTGTP